MILTLSSMGKKARSEAPLNPELALQFELTKKCIVEAKFSCHEVLQISSSEITFISPWEPMQMILSILPKSGLRLWLGILSVQYCSHIRILSSIPGQVNADLGCTCSEYGPSTSGRFALSLPPCWPNAASTGFGSPLQRPPVQSSFIMPS